LGFQVTLRTLQPVPLCSHHQTWSVQHCWVHCLYATWHSFRSNPDPVDSSLFACSASVSSPKIMFGLIGWQFITQQSLHNVHGRAGKLLWAPGSLPTPQSHLQLPAMQTTWRWSWCNRMLQKVCDLQPIRKSADCTQLHDQELLLKQQQRITCNSWAWTCLFC